MVLTEARLEQGAITVAGTNSQPLYAPKNPSRFIGYICQGVAKECTLELTAYGLSLKEVRKSLIERARNWYKEKS